MSDLIRREDALALFAEDDNVPTEIVRALIEDLPAVTVQAQIDAAVAAERDRWEAMSQLDFANQSTAKAIRNIYGRNATILKVASHE